MKYFLLRFKYYSPLIAGILCFSLQSCFLFPPTPPPQGTDSTITTPKPPEYSFSRWWVISTRGAIMDVSPVGNIVSVGDTTLSNNPYATIQVFSPDAALLHRSELPGLGHDVVAAYSETVNQGRGACILATLSPIRSGSATRSSRLDTYFAFMTTSLYTFYNTETGIPGQQNGAYSTLINPSIAQAAKEIKIGASSFTAAWMVGSFCDSFHPSSVSATQSGCPTFGKADCFVIRRTEDYAAALRVPNAMVQYVRFPIPVRHQWGGPENDLAYDVASDEIGNATIFLRAGSDFAITSATQSLVKMKIGYNIVRLDTNGLLTETFSVRLDAQREISNTKIALAPNNVIYITAKDEQKKQYFLAKVNSSGTEWIRYFHSSVSTGITYFYGYYSSLDLTTDSRGNVYLTGSYYDASDFGSGKVFAAPGGTMAFVAKYSPSNVCLEAMPLGSGTGISIRLSPQEDAIYINGWGTGPILGVNIPDPNANLPTRDREFRSPAFLVKLRIR
jgi:hypothetical protein